MRELLNFIRAAAVTPSGILLACCLVAIYFSLVTETNDIIALVVVTTLGLFLILLAIFVLFFGKLIKRRASFTIQSSSNQNFCYSQTKNTFLISLKPITIPILCNLEITLKFKNETAPCFKAIIASANKKSKPIKWEHIFSHRGIWEIAEANYALKDYFGIFKYRWTDNFDSGQSFKIKVFPAKASYLGIPTLASTHKEGDSIVQPPKRSGDYLDMKRYHPSDGAKRILWKLYAKSGELFTRHPEEAVSPSGLAVLYCLSKTKDDRLAQIFSQYITDLERAGIDIMAGCLGSQIRSENRTDSISIATNSSLATELLINSAWDADKLKDEDSILKELGLFIKKCKNHLKDSHINSFIIFTSDLYLSNPWQLASTKAIGGFLKKQGIEPIFCLIDDSFKLEKPSETVIQSTTFNKIKNIFIKEEKGESLVASLAWHLADTCRLQKWPFYHGIYGK
jgi:hypothetical protein